MTLFRDCLASDYIKKFILLSFSQLCLILIMGALLNLNWSLYAQPSLYFLGITSWLILQASVFYKMYKKSYSSFERASAQVEGWLQEDYSLRAKPPYSDGVVSAFHKKVNLLSNKHQERKTDEDVQSFLMLKLIGFLNTPTLLFDQRIRLSFGNAACQQLFNQPWETLKYSSPSLLGLRHEPEWAFKDPEQSRQWQLRHSEFIHQGNRYHLVVCIDIRSALREQEIQSWQKLIRVMSHEIRNSLTPVTTILERLSTRAHNERDAEAFDIVLERCVHLQDFIKRYGQLNQPLTPNFEKVKSEYIVDFVQTMFTSVDWHIEHQVCQFRADHTLLNQVLINLIKNAIEASVPGSKITLEIIKSSHSVQMKIVDCGHGILNEDNLFVPFYTTKPNGEGIGLSLSRHFIEQMGGKLTLENRDDTTGAISCIQLPL